MNVLLTETTAYRQLLNTTGSSYSLTSLSTDEVDSGDDVEKNILPRRPGPISSPRQTAPVATAAAAAAASAPIEGQDVPKQPITVSPCASALSNSGKRSVPFKYHIEYVLILFVFFCWI